MKKDQQSVLTTAKPTKLRLEHLASLEPITDNQRVVFDFFKKEYHMVLSGSAGSGKTFLSMALALEQVLNKESPFDKLIIVRSVVPTRDIGFLPGTKEEKEDVYTQPYISIAHELFEDKGAYEKLVTQGALQFLTTSYIRGTTLRNAIVLVDEMQNLNFHELDSVITRVGENCRFIMCGDYYQTDFEKKGDKDGIIKFLNILDNMKRFKHVEFTWKDIVRSDLVREYIVTKEMLESNS
jgi:phosphate starvation-inducible PhoH-like protein